jgi:hypothetical protein
MVVARSCALMLASLDRDREGGAELGLVLPDHHRQIEPPRPLLGQGQADEPAGLARHEVDGLGRDEARRQHEVALVLALLVVDEDHHVGVADLLDGALDALEDEAGVLLGHAPAPTSSARST